MRESHTKILALLLLLVISAGSFAGDKKIKVKSVINKYGFDSWITESTKCVKVNRTLSRGLTRCVSQGHRPSAFRKKAKVRQYKCRFKDKSKAGELLIYPSHQVCMRQLNSMYLEGN